MSIKKALIVVDLQNDFMAGGSLAVNDAEAILPIINRLQDQFELVVATQDWHPRDHTSFADNHPGSAVGEVIQLEDTQQVLWPVHCVQDTPGAALHSQLKTERIQRIFHKGVDKYIDSYSAFFDNAHRRSTGLGEFLRAEDVKQVYVVGLATDFCVCYSSLDAAHLGFDVYVVQDACRGIDLHEGDIARAFDAMTAVGVTLIESSELLKN